MVGLASGVVDRAPASGCHGLGTCDLMSSMEPGVQPVAAEMPPKKLVRQLDFTAAFGASTAAAQAQPQEKPSAQPLSQSSVPASRPPVPMPV